MSGSRRSVLVGFADALAAPEAAASLLGAGHRVVSFARRGRPVALRRLRGVELVEVTAPEDDLAACVAEVAAVAAGHDATMPLDDQAVLVCDRALPADAPVAGPRGAQAAFALDKRLQLRAAEAAGLAVPVWTELPRLDGGAEAPEPVPSPAELPDPPAGGLPDGLALPAVCKPALAAEEMDGRLRRFSPRLVRTQAELDAARHSWGPATPAIVQRWVSGVGAGVFGLADDSGVHHLSAHRRVRMMNPAGSGSSACASAAVPGELVASIQRLLEAAGWRGMFMVELLRAGDTWWFMELNGRPWGSLALARRLGFEYPAWAVARVWDADAPLPVTPEFSELECRHLGRELVHLLFVLRGPGSHVGAWPGRRETVRALLGGEGHRTAESHRMANGHRAANGHRTAWYNLGPGMGSVFVEDTWRTVRDQTWGKRRAAR